MAFIGLRLDLGGKCSVRVDRILLIEEATTEHSSLSNAATRVKDIEFERRTTKSCNSSLASSAKSRKIAERGSLGDFDRLEKRSLRRFAIGVEPA